MSETKKDFMLLAVHTDREFTSWLQSHAEDGWWLNENKGNTFVFSKKPYDGKRVCSFTVNSPRLGESAEDTFYDYLDGLRKRGWDLLTMGMPESFTDRTRHAFLYELPREDLPHPEIPLSDPEGQTALLRKALRKALSTLALCLIYAGVLAFFVLSGRIWQFSGLPVPVFLTLTGVVMLPCIFFSVRAVSLYAKALRDPAADSSAGDFRSLDRAVVLSSVMLAILAVFLILDLLL